MARGYGQGAPPLSAADAIAGLPGARQSGMEAKTDFLMAFN